MNFSLKKIIAIIALKIGIKCKKTPDLLAPIIDIPLIHKRKDAKPGNKTTYDKIKIKGSSKLILKPTLYSIKYTGIKNINPKVITT